MKRTASTDTAIYTQALIVRTNHDASFHSGWAGRSFNMTSTEHNEEEIIKATTIQANTFQTPMHLNPIHPLYSFIVGPIHDRAMRVTAT